MLIIIYGKIQLSITDDKIKSSIKVDVYKGQYRTFKCIITNTNNSVNGNKTATIETNEVTVAYVQGQLTSIEAQYIGEYEKFNYEDFYTNGKVTVTETYTNGNTQNEVEVTADESRYTISPTKYDEKAIGYVPYTVQYNENQNISTKIRVPVKYELNANDFAITSSTSSDGQTSGTSGNDPEKIAQFTGDTVLTVGPSGEISSVPSLIYETENSDSATDYNIMKKLQSVWKKTINNQTTDFTDTNADNSIAGTYIYSNTLTVPTDDTWVIGESIQLDYYVQVYPWTLAVNSNDGNSVEDLQNLTGNTEYTLSATNDADTTSTVTWSSNNTSFTINNNKLTTPTATTTDQTATITAKVDNVTIGTITVIVKQLGSMANPFTNWNELCKYLSESETDLTTIYVQGSLDATETATVNRPVKIIPVGGVTITLYENLSEQLFTVNADLTLKGYNASNQFTIDGNLNEPEVPLIRTDNSNITLEYVTMQSYTNSSQDSSNPEGGAISFNCAGKTLSLINCNFTNVITNIAPNVDFDTPIGAICFRDGKLILDSCTFTQNGEYVDLYCSPDDTSKITLKGNITLPIIQYANAFTSYFGDLQITLDDSTFNSENIQIYVDNISDGYDTDLFTLNNGQTLPEYFKLLNDGYEFNYTDGTITAATSGGSGGTQLSGTLVTDFSSLQSAVDTGTASVIIIGEDIELTNYISITREVTIAANSNVTLTQPSGSGITGHIFSITSTGDLTLGGGAGTLTLTGHNNGNEELIYINKGTLTLKDKCTITGVTNTQAAHAIGIVGGTFNMSGGEISNNTAGTAIYADKDTQASNIEMNIYGGLIYGNKGGTNGGALYMGKNSSYSTTVNIYGNVQIYNNTATTSGGSIYMTGSSNILNVNSHASEENNAAIYDNYKGDENQGASIYKNGGTFNLNGSSATGTLTPYSENIKP